MGSSRILPATTPRDLCVWSDGVASGVLDMFIAVMPTRNAAHMDYLFYSVVCGDLKFNVMPDTR